MTCQVVDGFILIGPKTVKDYLLLILGIFSDVRTMQIERILRCVEIYRSRIEGILFGNLVKHEKLNAHQFFKLVRQIDLIVWYLREQYECIGHEIFGKGVAFQVCSKTCGIPSYYQLRNKNYMTPCKYLKQEKENVKNLKIFGFSLYKYVHTAQSSDRKMNAHGLYWRSNSGQGLWHCTLEVY